MSLLDQHFTRRTFTAGAAALGTLAAGTSLTGAQDATPEATPTTDSILPAQLPNGGTNPDGSWTFTDDRGHVIEFPQTPTKVIAFLGFAAALYDFGFEVVGYVGGNKAGDDDVPASAAGRLPIDRIPAVNDGTDFDPELAIQLGAELYIAPDYALATEPAYLWPLSADASVQIADLMPVLHVAQADGTDARRTVQTMANIATALGVDVETPEIAQQATEFETAVTELETQIAAKPGLSTLWMSGGPSGWWISQTSPDLNLYRSLGLEFIQDGFVQEEELSWETFVSDWPCDVIFNDNRAPAWWSVEQLKEEIPTYPLHPAVEANQVYPWNTVFVPSWLGYTPDVVAVTEAINAASPDIVTE